MTEISSAEVSIWEKEDWETPSNTERYIKLKFQVPGGELIYDIYLSKDQYESLEFANKLIKKCL